MMYFRIGQRVRVKLMIPEAASVDELASDVEFTIGKICEENSQAGESAGRQTLLCSFEVDAGGMPAYIVAVDNPLVEVTIIGDPDLQ